MGKKWWKMMQNAKDLKKKLQKPLRYQIKTNIIKRHE